MAFTLKSLRAAPNALAAYYTRFRVTERVLLSGHSHQAWPDVAFDGQMHAWQDAADMVDEKWECAMCTADTVREGYARLLEDSAERIALGPATHDLLVKLLSALPLKQRPKLVTTTGEFHALRRQLDRLGEAGIEVVKVPHAPAADVAERVAQAVDDRTAAAFVSAVFYENAHIVPGLARALQACRRVGAELIVDAYHALNVVPFALAEQGLQDAYITGGGYKYCQLGEGNGFLRVPPGRDLRPVVTGWFSEFASLYPGGQRTRVEYGPGPAVFAGATYDPTSHYRAAAVFRFFQEHELNPRFLREVSQHQVGRLIEGFDALDQDPRVISRDRTVPLTGLGGFLALQTPRAAQLHRGLRERGVWSDYRGEILRLGPAPYVSDAQLDSAVGALRDAVQWLPRAR